LINPQKWPRIPTNHHKSPQVPRNPIEIPTVTRNPEILTKPPEIRNPYRSAENLGNPPGTAARPPCRRL